MAATHPTLTTSYEERAKTAGHPLTSYLLRLMELKGSNLCLSADVTNARELLHLADKVGPSIVVLKTHYDLVAGWDYNPQTGTGAKLAALARRHGFLIFEDRKFADIGKTVQLQYTGGTARIVEWAHIVNVNIQAGKEVVRALAEAAANWRERIKYEVRTSVTVGTPISDSFEEDADEEVSPTAISRPQQVPTQRRQPSPHHESAAAKARKNSGQGLGAGPVPISQGYGRDTADGRKGSIVSITTVTQSYEPADSPRLSKSMTEGGLDDVVFPGIEEAPLERGLLILAQMRSTARPTTPSST
ncbi:orotidine 5'-phosphate decarboxylase [Magnaporthiopsis poae ATCC 64411]|uniref:Orotidine 5'-phosphate decarboxylase n=1 Tax=Magnaporthiopsis poae (strain ATCC 64411 / 73-15) TaxID=644358 RepID=A0A0C4E7L1_MAGP6|nr:orotidine 5'-phosphate decarboxylase [Magnaporthiopsis poae ATCC 64411]